MGHVERGVHYGEVVFLGGVLQHVIRLIIRTCCYTPRSRVFQRILPGPRRPFRPDPYQVALGGHGHKDEVVSDADLLTLGPLLGRWVHGPPAGLALRVLLQAHVEGQLVVGGAGREARQVLQQTVSIKHRVNTPSTAP